MKEIKHKKAIITAAVIAATTVGGVAAVSHDKNVSAAKKADTTTEDTSSTHKSRPELSEEKKAKLQEKLENMTDAERDECVFPVEYIFRGLDAVTLSPFFSRLARSGLEIYLKKINLDLPLGTRVRLCDENGFFALGEVREFEGGRAIKPIRQF